MYMDNVVLIDICGTLFNSNTTFDFLDCYIHNSSYRRFRRVMKSPLWRYFNSAVYRIFSLDMSRRIALSHLAGYSRHQLDDMAEAFYRDYLLPRKIQPVWQLMESYGNAGTEIVLVSGTIDPVARAVARHIGVERYVSSKLRYDTSDICKGRLADDVLRTKHRKLADMHIVPPYEHVVTDNPKDVQLVQDARQTTIVVHGGIKRWRFLTRNLKNVSFIQNV